MTRQEKRKWAAKWAIVVGITGIDFHNLVPQTRLYYLSFGIAELLSHMLEQPFKVAADPTKTTVGDLLRQIE